MKANTVKTQILDTFSIFAPIAKVADVQAEIKGTNYRVKIKKGEVTKILADRKAVWTPDAGDDAISFLNRLVHPIAEKKIDAQTPVAKKTKVQTAKKTKVQTAKKTRKVVDEKWIAHLVEEANKSPELHEGDEIRFRVATSHGKPVCAHVDLYTDGEKMGTAGVHHRVGFAALGIDKTWTDRVDNSIRAIYRTIGTGQLIKKDGATVKVDNGNIIDATGELTAVLDIIKSI